MNRNTIGPIGLGVLMGRRGQHLSVEERAVIFSEHLRGGSQRQIAVLLGRAPSTICRELARGREGGGTDPAYCPQRGQRVYAQRRARCRPRRKLVRGGASYLFVRRHLLDFRWSPEQIAAKLGAMHPDDPAARVSHETIYAMIYAQIWAQPRGGLKAAMVEALRQGKTRRGTRRRTLAGSAIVPESLKIIHRPEEVAARLIPGHWPYGDWKTIACRLTGR